MQKPDAPDGPELLRELIKLSATAYAHCILDAAQAERVPRRILKEACRLIAEEIEAIDSSERIAPAPSTFKL